MFGRSVRVDEEVVFLSRRQNWGLTYLVRAPRRKPAYFDACMANLSELTRFDAGGVNR